MIEHISLSDILNCQKVKNQFTFMIKNEKVGRPTYM